MDNGWGHIGEACGLARDTLRRLHWIRSLLLLFGFASCSTLYGLDSTRPSLGKDDEFVVDPVCLDVPIDPSAIATVERIVTLTGRRGRSNLGAESVPVSVRIGDCDCLSEHDAKGAVSPDGPALDCGAEESAGGMAGVPGMAPGDPRRAPSCAMGLPLLSKADSSIFELKALEGRGCKQRSPSRLDCILNGSGEAAFGVTAFPRPDALQLAGYLPVCITPNDLDKQIPSEGANNGDSTHQQTMAVIPRFGGSRVALAVAELARPSVTPGSKCESLVDCDAVHARARFQVSFVSPDVPANSIRDSDFRAVSREVLMSAELSMKAGQGFAFLSLDPSCKSPNPQVEDDADGASGATLNLRIGNGQSDSEVFYLCAPGGAAEYEIIPALRDGSIESPVLRSAEVSVEALTSGYSFTTQGNEQVLVAHRCGAGQSPAMVSSFVVQAPLSVSPDGQRIVLACDTGDIDQTAGEGGSAQMVACGSTLLELQLAPEGTCTLVLD